MRVGVQPVAHQKPGEAVVDQRQYERGQQLVVGDVAGQGPAELQVAPDDFVVVGYTGQASEAQRFAQEALEHQPPAEVDIRRPGACGLPVEQCDDRQVVAETHVSDPGVAPHHRLGIGVGS